MEAENNATTKVSAAQAAENVIEIFLRESAENENWKEKFIHASLYLLGAGAFGSVFLATTKLHPVENRRMKHEDQFLKDAAKYMGCKVEYRGKHSVLKDKSRDTSLLDNVAIKFEFLEKAALEDGSAKTALFLRHEQQVLHNIWKNSKGQKLIGFPLLLDFGYLGDVEQYGIAAQYHDVFTYSDLNGQEVPFLDDPVNQSLEKVTRISYMAMELIGPSIDDIRRYMAPLFEKRNVKPYFTVATSFKIADQTLCRLLLLHQSGFVHHDLKLDNIAIGIGRAINTVYLIDYGFAKRMSGSGMDGWTGSRKFMSVDTFALKPVNFSQDIESWFYVILTLLYDHLPWSDEAQEPGENETEEEKVMWARMNKMKSTWWGAYNDAVSLHQMVASIEALHKEEVPDIAKILHMLHSKTRHLRNMLKQVSDSSAVESELANMSSPIFCSYMSVRQVLLQIYDLPRIHENRLLDTAEYRSLVLSRRDKKYVSYPWQPKRFWWDFDATHAKVVSDKKSMASETFRNISKLANSSSSVDAKRYSLRRVLAAQGPLLGPKEKSYVYKKKEDTLYARGQRTNPIRRFSVFDESDSTGSTYSTDSSLQS